MVIIADAQGTSLRQINSPIYQGSHLANEIVFIAPFSSQNTVTVAFKLPNGIITPPLLLNGYNMAYVDIGQVFDDKGVKFNAWRLLLPNTITEYSGNLTIQFTIYTGTSRIASMGINVEINKGVATIPPSTPTPTIYEEILDALTTLSETKLDEDELGRGTIELVQNGEVKGRFSVNTNEDMQIQLAGGGDFYTKDEVDDLLEEKVDTTTFEEAIEPIQEVIPTDATSDNQLADKRYVNDSINSVTAYWITKDAQGNSFPTRQSLLTAITVYSGGVVRVPTRNDYAYVLEDETHNNATARYVYDNGWKYQITLNEIPFTQAQLDALNSGATATKIAKITPLESGLNTAQSNITALQSNFVVVNSLSHITLDDTLRTVVPVLTDSQVVTIYNAITTGKVVYIHDNFDNVDVKVTERAYVNENVTIGCTYLGRLALTYSIVGDDVEITYRELGGVSSITLIEWT